MRCIRFWGTRGSLPVALTASAVRSKVIAALRGAAGRTFASDDDLQAYVDSLGMTVSGTYGGHSPCVEIETGGADYVLCDLGSGVRPFGQKAMARHGAASPQTYHIFMSHVHWDHIMGFPFFTPAYLKGNHLRIYGGHAGLEDALRRQHGAPSFPVDFSALCANIEFVRLEPERQYDVAGLKVDVMLQRHAGDSYGYRFSSGGKSVVYATDSEHMLPDLAATQGYVDFFRDADLVIFDAMYSLADSISVKADWGHSSNIVGVELCHLAGARHLCLFHHEPIHGDEAIARILAETRRFEEISRTGKPLLVTAAYDGMEVHL
jgi:phosphoribosyl 1,2-cyclic phosphodiesterase